MYISQGKSKEAMDVANQAVADDSKSDMALSLRAADFQRKLDLAADDARLAAYLRGEVITSSGENGWLAVAGGRIAAIGRLDSASAKQTIDARGRVVAPGFIDAHTHETSDATDDFNQGLLDTLQKLEAKGNTLVVVEHDEDTIRRAAHVIDLGPGAGKVGGEVIAEGTAIALMKNPQSITGRFLAHPLQHPLHPPRTVNAPRR